jgi:phosphohistidine phosphatase SixA
MPSAPAPGFRFIQRFALLAGGLLALTAAMAQPAPELIAPSASSAPDSAQAVALPNLASALRQGGHVIYFRHTATDFSRTDAGMRDYADCGNQRMLSSQGRSQARDIGRRIAALKLPPVQALASPMCRTLETAQLMFGHVTPNNTLREGAAGDYPGLKQLLASPVAAGSNRWLVGHGTPFRAIAGPPHLAEGEAAVIRPDGKHWTVVARVLPQEWAQLK